MARVGGRSERARDITPMGSDERILLREAEGLDGVEERWSCELRWSLGIGDVAWVRWPGLWGYVRTGGKMSSVNSSVELQNSPKEVSRS